MKTRPTHVRANVSDLHRAIAWYENEPGFVQEGYAQAEGIAFAEERLRAFWRETFDVVELRRARTSWESGSWYRCVFQKRRRPLQALAIRNR